MQRIRLAFPQDANRQKLHERQQHSFAAEVAALLSGGVTFVGEEINPDARTIARGLAEVFNCSYSLIDMPLAERVRQGCHADYEILFFDSPDDVMRCHRLREEYMRQRIFEHLSDGSRGLVICGLVHAERLKDDLATKISQVVLKSVADYDWFDKSLYGWPP